MIIYSFLLILLLFVGYKLTPKRRLYSLLMSLESKLAALKTYRRSLSDFDVAYYRGGRGDTLVLLHGFGSDKNNWNRLAFHLTRHFDVIAIDLPGFGESSKNKTSNYGVEAQVTRICQLLDSLNIDQCHIAGSSMGGYIAGNLAAAFPSRTLSLWLIDPLGVSTSQTSEMFRAIKQGAQPVVLPRNHSEFEQLFRNLFVRQPFVPSAVIKYLGHQAELSAPLNSQIFQQIHRIEHGEAHFTSPLEVALSQYALPTLITWGDKDRIVDVSGAYELSKVVPQSHLSILKDVGHLPMLESPRKTAASFVEFVKCHCGQ